MKTKQEQLVELKEKLERVNGKKTMRRVELIREVKLLEEEMKKEGV